MNIDSVLLGYQARLEVLQAEWVQVRIRHAAAATVLLAAIALSVALGFEAVRQRFPLWWPSLPLPIVAFSARQYSCSRVLRSRTWRLMRCYNLAIQRVNGLWL